MIGWANGFRLSIWSNREVDLTGWTLSDMRRPRLNLSKALTQDKRLLLPGQAVRVQPVAPMMLSNNSGVIALLRSAQ